MEPSGLPNAPRRSPSSSPWVFWSCDSRWRVEKTLTSEVNPVHGGLEEAELRALGLRRHQVIDFSSNLNPLGPSLRVRKAAAEAGLSDYPDRHSLILREALAARLGVETENIMVGNGSTELIHLLARAFIRPGEKSLIFEPTFGEYEAAASQAGADTVSIRAVERQGFLWPVAAAVRAISHVRPKLAFLCNPNNPTGVHLSRGTVEELRSQVADSGMLMLDDAYAPFADHRWDTTPLLKQGGVAILRSMTKDHALAGVRLGYMLAEPDLVAVMRELQPSWSVNAVAQAAGLAALGDEAHLDEARMVVSDSKRYLCRELESLGIAATRSAANFVLARVGNASDVRMALLRRGIAVRDCTSFGLPEHIRIAIRRRAECEKLVEALEEEVADGR
ncbi:MAG: histidinol-phosphate aminotransferase family protein [Acidimicrobiia bacterium]|nr:histidinol-phosphate aminotransferase family protein [Acidimicrobiia bacterium]